MKSLSRSLPSLIWLILITSGCNQSASPDERTGLSAERLEHLSRVLDEYAEKKEVAGGVALIAHEGNIGYLKSFGDRDMESQDEMESDDIFRIASMTKAVTVVGIMTLFENGYFTLDEPISRFIPEFASMEVMVPDTLNHSFTLEPANSPITFRHLLNHTSGMTYDFFGQEHLSELYIDQDIYNGLGASEGSIGDMVKRLAKLPLVHHPGDGWQYGMNMDVLGYLIEVISGKPLDEYLQNEIFEPLEMRDTYFYLPDSKSERLATLYGIIGEEKISRINGVYGFHSDFDTHQANQNYFSGGGGLYSTAEDYYHFLQMLLNKGLYKETRILNENTVELITTEEVEPTFPWLKGNGFGFGFAISRGPDSTDGPESPGTYSWLGYFNTYFWVDPQERLIGILLTQINPDNTDINVKFKDLMYQSLRE